SRDCVAFLGVQSCQKPPTYLNAAANTVAELSVQLDYLLCVARFAHYLRLMGRDLINSCISGLPWERMLNDWLAQYVLAAPEDASDEARARRPLTAGQVQVRAVRDNPERWEVIAWLAPAFQFDILEVSLHLVIPLPPGLIQPGR